MIGLVISEVGQVGVAGRIHKTVISVVVLLLEVLVGAELAEESEEDVQGFDHWFAVL